MGKGQAYALKQFSSDSFQERGHDHNRLRFACMSAYGSDRTRQGAVWIAPSIEPSACLKLQCQMKIKCTFSGETQRLLLRMRWTLNSGTLNSTE